ncbi:PspA/IM30 family protein [Paucibacter sp. PLA-PC-4]|uniref:PspA/IM30 family protein n=1 Tax=Paucibacter sp. PLA-PC-4 TaxID=2993655 RepID=UPI0022487712|nr:PspA/IM30 family protein [Paucibacter sp. PLA-PC-4]MCX2860520.1 PspA/IM30 family protein [Paucibacter sp. PLA-PC-4]
MAETLKNRVGRVMAGGVHALLDRIEDRAPEAMMEQALRELDGVVDEVRHELGVHAANRHLAQQRHAELNKQHEALKGQIELALGQQREELARAAVGRQLDIETQLPLLEASLAELARQEGEHRGYVDALLAKRREMEAALSQFRQSRAGSSAATAAGVKPAGDIEARIAGATGAFDRVYERQTGLAGPARAMQVEQAGQLQSLEDLARQTQIDARLAQLKQGS